MGALYSIAFGVLIILVFFLGILSYPMIQDLVSGKSTINYPTGYSVASLDQQSPSDWTSEKDFVLNDDGLLFKNKDVILAKFAPTRSMDPTLDSGMIGIEMKVKDKEKINVGDIIVFSDPRSEEKIVHRVVGKIKKNGETCFETSGDNAPKDDFIVCDPLNVLLGVFY